jgi:hypothetical protein
VFIFQVYAVTDGQLLTRAILAPDRRTAVATAVEVVKRQFPGGRVTRIVPVLDVTDVRRLHHSGIYKALAEIDQIGLTTFYLFGHVEALIGLTRQLIAAVREAKAEQGGDE